MTKRCVACSRVLAKSHFDKSTRTDDGLMVRCRECNVLHREAAQRRYALSPAVRETKAKYCELHSESRKARQRQRYATDPKIREAKAKYCELHSESRKARQRQQYATDPVVRKYKAQYKMKLYRTVPKFRVDNNISSQIRQSLARGKSNCPWEVLVGYSLDQLIHHLEAKFEQGMNWDNYGEWHIDHRTPRTWFRYDSATDPAFKACWALGNLQPKWGRLNIKKGNRYAD